MDNYKGYTLFNDIDDNVLRNRNRAVVLANIAEFNIKKKKINNKGASLIIGYFDCIPKEERNTVYENFTQQMKERGYAAN